MSNSLQTVLDSEYFGPNFRYVLIRNKLTNPQKINQTNKYNKQVESKGTLDDQDKKTHARQGNKII